MVAAELDGEMLILIGQFKALQGLLVAAVTFFFYDYAVSLKREISTIWIGKWTTLNVLYLLSRYIPFINFIDMGLTILIDINPKLCLPMFQFSLWTSIAGMIIAESFFYLRAYALWGTSRTAAILLIGLFSAMVIAGFVVDGIMAASATQVEPPFQARHIFPQCVIVVTEPNYAICGWIIITGVDTALITMIIYAKTRLYRSFTAAQNNLLSQVYRDALLYFFCNLSISIISIILSFVAQGPLKAASSTCGVAMFSILSCKIMLRLREYGNSHFLDQDIVSLGSNRVLSSLRFTHRTGDVEMTLPECFLSARSYLSTRVIGSIESQERSLCNQNQQPQELEGAFPVLPASRSPLKLHHSSSTALPALDPPNDTNYSQVAKPMMDARIIL
ncbi:hypothetical protein P691DRAFT_778138 [Macrolepiota fuliginosa MF-IS2]|uniref:DUF6533 domain-containing protein n=1 Tax=Macrolepiota fuliginosa MF-IS2 TaxID=1400762 RepID=A0A9P5X510_9AGAR|nr:hypothetical protein P691DRAFT_778138 [Macrolepiota fuliginosa MF-IS2]